MEKMEDLLSYYSLYDVEIEYLLSEDILTDEDDLEDQPRSLTNVATRLLIIGMTSSRDFCPEK